MSAPRLTFGIVAAAVLGTAAVLSEATASAAAARAHRGSVRILLETENDSLEQATSMLTAHPDASRFAAARRAYKRLEGVIEFYSPALAAALNSRRQEVDDDDAPPPSSLAAARFPAVEAALFPATGPVDTAAARQAATALCRSAGMVRSLVAALHPTNAQLFELARQELARVATLGIAGFDAPTTGRAVIESADALDGLRLLFARSAPGGSPGAASARATLDGALAAAAAYLRDHPDFDRLDRIEYLSRYDRPAARALDALRRAVGDSAILIRRPWRLESAWVYDSGAFDPRAYAPDDAPRPTRALIALGARLFDDRRLSGPGTRACSSCHQPARAFTDGRRRPAALAGVSRLRNTPSLIDAALQPAQFADEHSVTVEEQIGEVIRSRAEMAGALPLVVERLRRDAGMRRAFADAFPGAKNSGLGELQVRQALAAYIRSLQHGESRFDLAVRGDTTALASRERRGFDLFMGKGRCATCHFAPLFGGTAPPRFLGSDVEVIGTPARAEAPAVVDTDSGRARVDRLALHLHAFKVPSLRNAARTAPYMHNGVFRTLNEVVRFYDAGGGGGAGAPPGNQTLPTDSLHLTADERAAIVAFIGALSDSRRPARR